MKKIAMNIHRIVITNLKQLPVYGENNRRNILRMFEYVLFVQALRTTYHVYTKAHYLKYIRHIMCT